MIKYIDPIIHYNKEQETYEVRYGDTDHRCIVFPNHIEAERVYKLLVTEYEQQA